MLNGTLTKDDVDWESAESLAALLLTSKILDNAAKVERERENPPLEKREQPRRRTCLETNYPGFSKRGCNL